MIDHRHLYTWTEDYGAFLANLKLAGICVTALRALIKTNYINGLQMPIQERGIQSSNAVLGPLQPELVSLRNGTTQS